MTALLDVRDLHVRFNVGGRVLRAVGGVSFAVPRGTSFGIVGESGSGKSTTAQAIMQLVEIGGGSITLGGERLDRLRGARLRAARARFQLVFQDPFSSLNPRWRVGRIVGEALEHNPALTSTQRAARVREVLDTVGLQPGSEQLFAHQFSGGQRQRLAIARALAPLPELIVCDEPVSALDVAIQAQVLNLLKRLQRDLGLTYVFISHDLGVVQHMCHQVGVMYLGRFVERAEAARMFAGPWHPYTWSLLAAGAPAGARRRRLTETFAARGEPPSPLNPPEGCAFASRCPFAIDRCLQEAPSLARVAPDVETACHRAAEVHAAGMQIMAAGGRDT